MFFNLLDTAGIASYDFMFSDFHFGIHTYFIGVVTFWKNWLAA